MRIGIIGSGRIGGTLAGLFARAGNAVALANSRGPDTLQELVEGVGEVARALPVEEAVAFGDMTHTSGRLLSRRAETNAILVASGDHAGLKLCPGARGKITSPRPWAFTTVIR